MGRHDKEILLSSIVVVVILFIICQAFNFPHWLRNTATFAAGSYVIYLWLIKPHPHHPFRFIPPKQQNGEAQQDEQPQDEKGVAVAHLKRQLESQRQQSIQIHDSKWVSIKTERSGQNLKIKWRLSPDLPEDYTLIGFKKTGGFSMNQFDLANNGPLVVESTEDGELTELLTGGEPYFFTFLLRVSSWLAGHRYSPVSRFQVAIRTDVEAEIEKMIRRLEGHDEEQDAKQVEDKQADDKKPTRPPNKRLIGALTDLGSFVEFEEVFGATLRTLIDRIEQSNYSEEEKREKIARLRDMGSILREQYQQ